MQTAIEEGLAICMRLAGDVIRVHPNVKAVVFPTLHRVPSQGYALVRPQADRVSDRPAPG